MMKFSYTIVHVPGKELFAADALSRNPQKVPYKREELEAEIDAFIQMITSSLPASSRRLDELRVAQLKDETCQKLTDYVLKGWPSKKEVDTLCAPYWQNCYEISVQDGLFMRGCRIIIPKSHQAEVLNQIHEGHLGIIKCRARARCSVYWPGISKVIEEKIKSCTACIQESSNRHQPLIPTSFPERPWEVLDPTTAYLVNKKVLEAKVERRIEGQKTNYDKHHGVRNLDELDPGQNVWITDRRVTGKVLQKTPYPRSYLVQSGRRVYRRNRKHLIPSPDFHPEPEPEDDSDVTGYQHSPADADPGCPPLMSSPQSPKTYPEKASSSTEASPDPYVTRRGRIVRPPERLDL
ncbi:hypothetical protein AVEN_149880-1 [Araneus ventricosus]|uniref:RNA-directed DNA polymerase n=1 Tax=Araneus ventricosus TaxID=182803 RepID=A0A4Y2DWM6_ARAVE|nr:hypothetical protein AVEN_149880-1 [Araneus ventricosus]